VIAFGEHRDFNNRLNGLNDDDQKDFLRRDMFYRMQGRERWSDKDDAPLAVTVENGELDSLEVQTNMLKNWFKFRPSWGQEDEW
jgi:hypothetical protein